MEVKSYTNDELTKMLLSENSEQIICAIIYAVLYGQDYDYVMKICYKYYFSNDIRIKECILNMLPTLLHRYGNIDIDMVIDILKDAFKEKDRSASDILPLAEEVFSQVCHNFPEHKYRIKEQLKDVDLTKYDYMFVTKADIRRSLKKRRELEKKEMLCCKTMQESVMNDKAIDYEDIFRRYYIKKGNQPIKSINFCPWCSVNLGTPLNKEYFRILREEYNIAIPDLDNFTNIPDEFKTDEWWKKRGHTSGAYIITRLREK